MTVVERSFLLASLLLAPLAGHCGPAAREPATEGVSARCQVWARELSFARSVADHDAAAFSAHLHPHAVFGVSGQPTQGRDAIAAQWKGIIDGTAMVLEWYPEIVVEGGDGLVHSSGPALYRNTSTGDYRRSRYSSVWQRGAHDGTWRVVFDDGTPPEPADEAEVAAFRQGRALDCPAQ